jgi:hypothetical protein
MRRGTQRRGEGDARVPRTMQLLHGSRALERSHLHLDLRHWSHARGGDERGIKEGRAGRGPLLLLRRTARSAAGAGRWSRKGWRARSSYSSE